jgi:hypothetical protein
LRFVSLVGPSCRKPHDECSPKWQKQKLKNLRTLV